MRGFFRWLSRPDPWLLQQQAQLDEFWRNHPHLKAKVLQSVADKTAARNEPERKV